MGRPTQVAREKKIRFVLAVIAGEVSVADAPRKEGVSEASIHRWRNDFVEAGRQALVVGTSGPSGREAQLEAEVADLTQAWVRAPWSCGCGRSLLRAVWVLRGP